ncbi:hypothetical protein [Methylobacter svalbardensis]|uniref:hypothetical protein n=1 Tax=Methylobacter svalbardensis TaxID=3080016 RepID=UPI0030EEC456
MANWDLFRYRNPDGSSKDWAVQTHPDGSVTTRWGKTASRLPSSSTRNGVSQVDIELQKQHKGYVFIGEVTIDHEGNVSFPLQNPEPGTQPVTADRPETLYWHIDCNADPETCLQLGSELRRMIAVLYAYDEELAEVEQIWNGWQQLFDLTLTPQAFTQSGQLQSFHGAKPWLLLMALKFKFKGFAGVEIGIATEHSRELSADLKAELEILGFFGGDLESIRSVAEQLGLLKPKLNLAQAMAEQDDSWF